MTPFLGLLALSLAAPLAPGALDVALLSAGEAGPECRLQSTAPPAGPAASELPAAEVRLEQLFLCGEEVAVVDFLDEGGRVAEGARQLEKLRWGGPKPPAALHDGLLRYKSVVADVSGARSAAVLLENKLEAKGFAPLGVVRVDVAAKEAALARESRRGGRAGPPGFTPDAVRWTGYDDGLREAAATRKPVCLVFYTTWCPHCHNYLRVFDDPRVVLKSQSFVMVKLDADQNSDLSRRYAPDGDYIPRTFFLSPDGELQPALAGRPPPDRYLYDESDPASLLAGMDRALASIAR